MNGTEHGYKLLGAAIVAQAGVDYLEAKKRLSNMNRDTAAAKELMGTILAIKNFFRSEWCSLLTDVDGEHLMHEIDKEYIRWKIEENKKLGKTLEL